MAAPPDAGACSEMTPTAVPTDVRTLANHIGGTWTPSTTTQTLEDRDPATGDLLALVPLSTSADVDAAVTAARAAATEWRRVSPIVRARAVARLRDILDEHRDEIAELVTRDMGKTLPDATAEVTRGIESCEAAVAMPHLLKGENLEGVATGLDVEMVRQPVGVVAAITPFNFPAMIPLWFMPWALAAGNAFILKPSEQDPLAGERIIELAISTGAFPEGLINLVHGAHDVVNGLLEHPGVDAISFVGSAKTARYVSTRAAEHGKRVQALGGAKNSMVVMPDADPDLMTGGVMGSSFGAAGQRCLAGSIAVLVGTAGGAGPLARADRQRRGAARGPAPGSTRRPTSARSSRPPSASASSRDIDQAEADGAQVVLDGRGDAGPGGCTLGPTILDGVAEDHKVAVDELFGPVLTFVRAADLDEAIAKVNSSRYGNASVIFTESGGAARAYRYGVEAGMVGVNVGVAAPIAWFPFSGWKDSIDGDLHANGNDAVEFYTRKKVVTSRWAA